MITKTCRQVFEWYVKFVDTSFDPNIMKNKEVIKKKHKKKIGITKKKNKLREFKAKNAKKKTLENNHGYMPCYHPGKECSKDLEECLCSMNDDMCDKFCYCSKDCKNRFPGCNYNQGICFCSLYCSSKTCHTYRHSCYINILPN